MTFTKMLKMLKKDPDLFFGSKSSLAYLQNLESIQHWLFESKSEGWEKMLKAKDWKVQIVRIDEE